MPWYGRVGRALTTGGLSVIAVLAYNNAIATFPPSVVAGMFSFRSREYFEAAGEERGPVRVQF